MTDAIANAANRLAEIKMAIGELQAEAREIEDALAVVRRYGGLSSMTPYIREDVAGAIETQAKHAIAQGFQMGQAEFEVLATRAIEEAGRPLTRTQILSWLGNNGTPMLGADASKNIGTKLWRARASFINIRGAGYWFRNRVCEAVAYHPISADLMEDKEQPVDAT